MSENNAFYKPGTSLQALLFISLLVCAGLFSITSCTSAKKKVATIVYDIPPTAPIPPEKYCFEYAYDKPYSIELNLVGDSAFGRIYYTKTKEQYADIKGVFFGTSLFVNYRMKSDSGIFSQNQEWRFSHDSLYNVTTDRGAAGIITPEESLALGFTKGRLRKVACK